MEKEDVQTNEEDSRVYELGFLLVPETAEDKVAKKVEVLKKSVEKHGGKVFAEGEPVFKELAYEMTTLVANKHYKYKDAYFGWLKFDMPTEKITAFELDLKKNTDLVRFTVVKTVREDTLYVPPKPRVQTAPAKEAPGVGENKEEKAEVNSEDTPEITSKELDEKIEKLVIE